MKLWTKEIEEAAKKVPLYCSDGKPMATRKVLVKYFYPYGAATWYITECDIHPVVMMDGTETKCLYGYVTVDGQNYEWGIVLLAELEEFKGQYGLGIERDTSIEPLKHNIGEFCNELYQWDKDRE